MRIIMMDGASDRVIAETDDITEAKRILEEFQTKGFCLLTQDGDSVSLKEPLPHKVYLLWPLAGGQCRMPFTSPRTWHSVSNLILLLCFLGFIAMGLGYFSDIRRRHQNVRMPYAFVPGLREGI